MSSGLLDVGSRVAGYQVEAFVARGGMAVVYKARDLRLQRTVALKVMAPELASDQNFRHRFTRESELAASIDHPNIIPIYAAGEENQLLYLVMRFVPGDHLGEVLRRRGRLEPPEVIAVLGQVGEALDAAHAHGLAHRDVKPANILLAGNGELAQLHVYLSDFGLTTKVTGDATTTTEGGVLGTLKYVAPERVTGNAGDHRADIYSFGCVLYEALAGQPPFVREEEAAWLYAHVSEAPPPLSQLRPDLPGDLDVVLARALAKDPADRYPNCRTLMRDFRLAIERGPGAARTPAYPGSPYSGPAGDDGYQIGGRDGDSAATTALPPIQPVEAFDATPSSSPPVGPDPNFRPYEVAPPTEPALAPAPAARRSGGGGRRVLPILLVVAAVVLLAGVVAAVLWLRPGFLPGGGGGALSMLPRAAEPLADDVFVWRHQDDEGWKIETATIDGRSGQTLVTGRENRAVGLSRDRRTIFYLREQDGTVTLRAMAADGASDRALFSDRTPECPRLGRPALRADGLLIVVCYERPDGVGKLNVMTPDGKLVRTLDEGRLGDPALSRDGSLAVYWQASVAGVVGGSLRIVRVDGGAPETLIEGRDGEYADPAWSPTADVLALRRWVGDDQWLLTMPVAGGRAGKAVRITPRIYYDQGPSWSPDGSQIAFRRGSDRASNLLVIAADGSNERYIANNKGYSASPIWSAR